MFELASPDGTKGFTRSALARAICSKYKWIYDEEEKACGGGGGGGGGGGNNVNSTGPFGIPFLHYLSDLLFHTVKYDYVHAVYVLGIDVRGGGGGARKVK